MQMKVLVDGIAADATDKQWTAQSEQHAAMLGQIGIPVDTILVRTWQQANPELMAPVNDPTTLGNAAAEINAIYPLYAQGAVTAKGKICIASHPQIVIATGRPTPLPFIVPSVDANSSAGDRLALVMIAGAGFLSASPADSGTVGGSGTGTLVLNGTMQDLATILKTLTIIEPDAGPDTIDIEAFGINGRLDDIQVAVVAVPDGPQGAAATYEFVPTVAGQKWVSATASVSASGVVTSTTLQWNTINRDPATDEYLSTQTIAIHEPLAQGCIADGRGGAKQPLANPSANGVSLPLSRTLEESQRLQSCC